MNNPSIVVTVRQPFAWLIVAGLKPIENRNWRTLYRGRLYIHAAKRLHPRPINQIEEQFGLRIDPALLHRSAVIGHVDLVDVVDRSPLPSFEGPYGWVLENPEQVTPIPLSGRRRLFLADLP